MDANKKSKLSRRDFLRGAGIAGAGVALAGCGAQPTPETIIEKVVETVVVEVEGETVVQTVEVEVEKEVEKVVTATPPPAEPVELSYWVVAGEARAAVYQDGVDRFWHQFAELLPAEVVHLPRGGCSRVLSVCSPAVEESSEDECDSELIERSFHW